MKELTTSSAAIWKYHHLAKLGNYGRYDIVIELPAGDAKALDELFADCADNAFRTTFFPTPNTVLEVPVKGIEYDEFLRHGGCVYASTAQKPIFKTPDGEVLPDHIVKRIPRGARGRVTLRAVPYITTVEGIRLEIMSLELHRANSLLPLVSNTLRR